MLLLALVSLSSDMGSNPVRQWGFKFFREMGIALEIHDFISYIQ